MFLQTMLFRPCVCFVHEIMRWVFYFFFRSYRKQKIKIDLISCFLKKKIYRNIVILNLTWVVLWAVRLCLSPPKKIFHISHPSFDTQSFNVKGRSTVIRIAEAPTSDISTTRVISHLRYVLMTVTTVRDFVSQRDITGYVLRRPLDDFQWLLWQQSQGIFNKNLGHLQLCCWQKSLGVFNEPLGNHRPCLWRPKQVFEAKMWSFPKPWLSGFCA